VQWLVRRWYDTPQPTNPCGMARRDVVVVQIEFDTAFGCYGGLLLGDA
jgi:hypothetical protein